MPRSRSSPARTSASGEAPVKSIPPFYCAYLLRSTVRHASLYIGSTPNPARRLAQHNGRIKGGAHRTHREKLRPWEIVMIVSGFTSRTGALQFEWAWQNTQASRHAAHNETDTNVRICSKTGRRIVKKSSSPRESLTRIMARLHLLLRSPYFSSWPLEVRFFKTDVHLVWQGWVESADTFVPGTISFKTDFDDGALSEDGLPLQTALQRLDVSGNSLKSYREKTQFLLDAGDRLYCGICHERLRLDDDLVVVCSCEACRCASHLLCLSSAFIQSEDQGNGLVPTSGRCPSCGSRIEWHILMREMTRRFRKHGAGLFHNHEDSPFEEEDPSSQPPVTSEESGGELPQHTGHQSPIDLLSTEDEDFGPSAIKHQAKAPRPAVYRKVDDWDDVDIVA
ncbi:Slx4p interacting protein [Microsporum audouinii]